jgi:hypothetical protein
MGTFGSLGAGVRDGFLVGNPEGSLDFRRLERDLLVRQWEAEDTTEAVDLELLTVVRVWEDQLVVVEKMATAFRFHPV